MATNPPLLAVEDNTDEDFFDKLLIGDEDVDFNVTTLSSASYVNESDEVKAFSNLSINELDENGDVNFGNTSNHIGVETIEDICKMGTAEERGNPLVSSSSFEFDNSIQNRGNEDGGTEVLHDKTVVSDTMDDGLSDVTLLSKTSGVSGSPGVKEVDWSAFHADSAQNGSNGLGSYSDFFSEFEGDNMVGDTSEIGPQDDTGNALRGPFYMDNSNNYGQYTEGYSDGIAGDQSSFMQDLNSIQYWESQYPGWKYDTSTGQWYEVDATESSTTNWNQASDEDNGYPPHMMFHPQYPGWYYDTIAQNWFALESYTASAQSTAQGEEQVGKDDASSEATAMYNVNQAMENHYGQNFSLSKHGNQQSSVHFGFNNLYCANLRQGRNDFSVPSRFVAGGNLSQHLNDAIINQNDQKQNAQTSYTLASGRSSAGHPAHALVGFGFGGKLIVMKHTYTDNLNFGSQNPAVGSISILNLAEVVNSNIDTLNHGVSVSNYFEALCQQSVPGPLAGGSVSTKELNKWIDGKITNLKAVCMDHKRAEVLSLLFSLLKIACQYYGKLRSPYGTDAALKQESDSPESAVAKLFASARSGPRFSQYDAVAQCLQQVPPEGQLWVTAAEVQSLLVSGRKREALQCAQEGQLWGPALVLAAQLGDQFYVETIKQMAIRHLVAGSPLRTLCLLIAGQPADVFSMGSTAVSSMTSAVNMSQQPAQYGANGMLDDWEENLAVITANRTKDDELVLTHLGDCLWKERSDIIAAHICYLFADASLVSYSDSARLCLVGADHWKFPRTYASPEAIQRTEIYEYSKTLGNSQFVLLPFQPYKFVYALMLAEVGRISEALKYCQAVAKSLKTGRTPEVETLRHLVSSFEERIKAHQQGAPKEFIGKLLNLFDSTAHRVVGGLPPYVPTAGDVVHSKENRYQSIGPRASTSQSTIAVSSLAPSQSMEPISEWGAADSNRMAIHTRSVSEPAFGRSPKGQADTLKEASSSGTSRFGRFGFGSQLLQKTVGLVLKPREGRQAKLGETNKFYYDGKLKRWVEEGAEPPAEETALPPPPTTTGFQLKSALQSEAFHYNRSREFKSASAADNSPGMPPLPPTTNQYSSRGRMGVRSRYVDTFNQGGGSATSSFQSPPVPSHKPACGANPKFFVPTPVSNVEQSVDTPVYNEQQQDTSSAYEDPSTAPLNDSSFHSPPPPSTMNMQRHASMNSISNQGTSDNGSFSVHSRRTASWSGSFNDPT